MKSSQHFSAMLQSGIHRPAQSNIFQATPLDIESAKNIARRLFETYDTNKTGVIESQECRSMISDAYSTVNRNFAPTEEDVHDYLKIHDRDKDGKLTLQDLERSCINYLCGRGGVGTSISGIGMNQSTMPRAYGGSSLKP